MSTVITGKDENLVHLKVVRIDNKLTVVDQDGRKVSGIIEFNVKVGTNLITTIYLEAESSSRQEDGTIQLDIKG